MLPGFNLGSDVMRILYSANLSDDKNVSKRFVLRSPLALNMVFSSTRCEETLTVFIPDLK